MTRHAPSPNVDPLDAYAIALYAANPPGAALSDTAFAALAETGAQAWGGWPKVEKLAGDVHTVHTASAAGTIDDATRERWMRKHFPDAALLDRCYTHAVGQYP